MYPADLINWMMVFVRVGTMLGVFPVFNSTNIPTRLKVALALLASFLIAPTLPPMSLDHVDWFTVVRLLGGEIAIGLLLGFVSRMVFFMLEFAGGIISTEIGLSMTTDFNPLSNMQTDLIGKILQFLAITLFLCLNMHHWVLIGLQRSYALLPVGGAHLSTALMNDVVGRTSQIFVVGIQISAPLLATSFLITMIFTIISRVIPQMNSFVDSFSIRTLAGMIVFGMTLNVSGQYILNYIRRLPEDFLRVAQLLGTR